MPEEIPLRALPAPHTNGNVPAVPEYVTVYPSHGYPEPESEEPVVPLSHYLWILRRHKWAIIAFVVACVASTIVVSSRLTPIYEATASSPSRPAPRMSRSSSQSRKIAVLSSLLLPRSSIP